MLNMKESFPTLRIMETLVKFGSRTM
ncbi:hypothetical protein E2C01_053608 [Portunus trituberculatus]|uniref:Uncharacterized protein n=1 Tax=Portunus trituberculatus TaxID=210409 RepID=A0A5B7GSK5_PORTR|nr:hypothetical protein [Portunus trituberculatus]